MPFVRNGEHRLSYDVVDIVPPWRDERPTLLFHHGIGADGAIWSDWIPVLADRFRIVRFDMRGFGESDVPPPDFRWTMDLLGGDILAVADASGAGRFHFVGESIGATIGLATAIARPERFLSLTLSNGAHVGGSVERVQAWKRTIDERGMTGWSDGFMADRFLPGAIAPKRWDWFARRQAAQNPHSVLNALGILTGADLRPGLPALRLPVLLMHPDRSPFIPIAVTADLYARLPDAELQVFAHARHGLPFSHSRECAAILRRFLDRKFPDPQEARP